MKYNILYLLLLIMTTNCFAQYKEGEDFCETKKNESYFPLGIGEKKFFWSTSYYTETLVGKKKIDGKTYIEFKQTWKEGNSNSLFLRSEKSVVYQYEEDIQKETVRYSSSFKKGHTWQTIGKNTTYTIVSFDGKLETPFCSYKNLLVMNVEINKNTLIYYYQHGKGLIGATSETNQLVAYITSTFKTD